MTEEQIKILEKCWDYLDAEGQAEFRDALTDAISFIRDTSEMLGAAHTLKFDKDTYIVRLGKEPYEYGVYVDGVIGDGDYSSWLEAYREVKEKR